MNILSTDHTINLFYKQRPNEKYSRQILNFDSGCLFWGKIFIESLLIFSWELGNFFIFFKELFPILKLDHKILLYLCSHEKNYLCFRLTKVKSESFHLDEKRNMFYVA